MKAPALRVETLGNGVRVVVVPLPQLDSVCLSVFVRTGSRHESARLNGISHVVEHMAFKGTHTRDFHRINLDAERLGAEVNAHTDKDHTAYHMRGRAADAVAFVHMLADIVQHSTFPEAELERERQVILQEYLEDEEDPLSMAFRLFDKLCFGSHPMAQPVIGTRRNLERLTRDDLLAYVRQQYTGANVVVAVAGRVEPQAIVAEVSDAFGAMPAGREHAVDAPQHVGGMRTRTLAGSSQCHVVLGYPLPALKEDYAAGVVAAALFGEGMSSPLMHEIRERRGLVYYAACSADISDAAGQFVVEASTLPEHVDQYCAEVARLLRAQAGGIDAVDLERARNQIAVRQMRTRERPFRLIEEAATDLFVFGRVRERAELEARFAAVTARQVREQFERMLAAPPAIAMAGKVPRGISHRIGPSG